MKFGESDVTPMEDPKMKSKVLYIKDHMQTE